ncbi:PREDICTED: F-box/kelch-repeat protein At1g24800-like [Camelina sativa]|uniref:F-box/kelch-repeat protein At1g24800-like n=1 Tax=Camelina sativa TaxID=90675 RepID=A0ABM0X4S5_CAMSA|nr:PREDICTED: F-box/kelch-repeat protein At1g24800-like [Camelina sativa]
MTMICDLPPELVGKIFTKIPITSLGAVRSTCKLWNALSKEWVLGEAAARQQCVGFMTNESKVCSLRIDVQGIRKGEDELVDPSVNQVDIFNQVEISKVFHCNGLLLCVVKDKSRLVVWNPYLGQTRWIAPRTKFHIGDMYALGYDKNNRNHKILRFLDDKYKNLVEYEIYDLSSNSWKVLKVTSDWEIEFCQGVSAKGNTYFDALEAAGDGLKHILFCFDFTRESLVPRLPFPCDEDEEPCCYDEVTVVLSCVREEQLAVLYQMHYKEKLEIWVTIMIEPNALSWSKFLIVDLSQHITLDARFNEGVGAFFIDVEENVAVFSGLHDLIPSKTAEYPTAFISGRVGYLKTVSFRGSPSMEEPVVYSSSYLPSLVQIQPTMTTQKEEKR